MGGGYFKEINYARGILAVLVVIGHVVTQTNISESNLSDIFSLVGSFIYSFHMYAFFFISGFVSYKVLYLLGSKEKINYIIIRAKRLMVPYFVMGIVYLPARLFLSGVARNEYLLGDIWKILIGENPDGALWFLYVLFIINVLACLFLTENNLKITIWIGFIVCFISTIFIFPAGVIGRLLSYIPFFALGIIVRINYDKVFEWFWDVRIFLISVLIFILFNVLRYVSGIDCIRIATALSGTACLMFISCRFGCEDRNIEKSTLLCRIVGLLGMYSLDIYIFSEPIKVVVRALLRSMPVIVNAVCTFAAAIVVPMIISKMVVRKVKILRKLFLGMD